jgi:DNA-binding HxlR family transcriptional regulator
MATMTAAQKRGAAKAEYDAFLAGCPSRDLLERISNKWVALIIAGLAGTGPCGGDGPTAMRYSELSRLLAGISPKMLTQTLRTLERDGLVSRTVVPTVPVTVSYELTPLGLSLNGVISAVKTWAQDNMDDVFAARADHDGR